MGNITKLIGLGLLLTAFNPANATFLIEGGTAGTIPSGSASSRVLEGGTADGWLGSQLSLDGPASLTFEFIGFEAGYGNQFLLNDEVIFDTEASGLHDVAQGTVSSSIGMTHTMDFMGGVLPFQFLVTTTGQGVMNGSNPDNSGGDVATPNFFLSIIDDGSATSGNSIWLALDDGGAGPDNDYDDMFIRVTQGNGNGSGPVSVPEPGSLALLSLSLIGLGVLRKRILKR